MTGEEIRMTLAKQIKYLRALRGYSQAQLAERADISLTFVSAIEQAQKWPYPDTLGKIADALQVEVSDLFTSSEQKQDDRNFAKNMLRAIIDGHQKVLDEICRKYLN